MSLKSAIQGKKVSEIRKITKETPIADLADMLEELQPQQRVVFFRLLNSDTQSEIFNQLETEYQEQLIKDFTDEQMTEIMSDLYSDDLANLLEEVPKKLAKKIIDSVSKDRKSEIKKLLRYEDDNIGSMMNVDIINLKQTKTVSAARKLVRSVRDEVYISHYLYVVDSKNRLTGAIALEDLLFATKTKKLKAIARPVGYVYTNTSKEEAIQKFSDYDKSVLPVLNKKKEVVGVITADDMIDVVVQEADDDIAKMAGITSDSISTYSKTSAFSIYKSRIFWLLLLLIPATFSHFLVEYFNTLGDDIIGGALMTTIIATIPLIMGSAGNAGSQSSATVIRSLAVGDITGNDYKKIFFKELCVATLAGVTLALVNFVRMFIIYSIQGSIGIEDVMLATGLSVSLLVILIIAKLLGGMLPLIAKSLGGDPAVMASPFLTTIIDTLAIGILFGVSIGITMLV